MPKRDGLRTEFRGGALREKKSAPDWREKVAGQLETSPPKDRTWRAGIVRPRVEMGETLNKAINRAAHKRGMSRIGYIRRAVAAMIAYDMSENFEEILRDSPRIRTYNPSGKNHEANLNHYGDDGTDFGPWKIVAVVDQ